MNPREFQSRHRYRSISGCKCLQLVDRRHRCACQDYSLLISAGDEIRLSPLYDLSSQLIYPELIEQRVAMKIGGQYNIPLIGLSEWQALASACRVNQETLMNRLRHLSDALPDVISAARDQALTDGLNHEVITTLAASLIAHAKARRAALDGTPSKRRRARKATG